MVERLSPPAVTIEQMVDTADGVELIVGVRRDERFGPVAMVGIGGVLTEVLDDVATALAPVDAARAQRACCGRCARPRCSPACGDARRSTSTRSPSRWR